MTIRLSTLDKPFSLLLTFGLVAGMSACGTEEDIESASLEAALELDDGGLNMEDEAPMFADSTSFADAQLSEETAEVDDRMTEDTETRRLMDLPDGVHYRVVVQWGQIPGNRDNDTARNWSGAFHVNRGAMVVRRTIAFDRGDSLLPRNDRTVVPFVSFTLPHRDGLVLDIVDPAPASGEPIALSYVAERRETLGAPAVEQSIALARLLDGRVELLSDDAENRMLAAAHARPLDQCDHGFLMGRWRRVSPRDQAPRGRFLGRVVTEDGTPRGHVRGIYGERRNGNQVFFGKYINRAGQFQGILRGSYGDGTFEGRWVTRSEEKGTVVGRIHESDDPGRPHGHFLGRWQEHTCNVR